MHWFPGCSLQVLILFIILKVLIAFPMFPLEDPGYSLIHLMVFFMALVFSIGFLVLMVFQSLMISMVFLLCIIFIHLMVLMKSFMVLILFLVCIVLILLMTSLLILMVE